MRGAGTRHYDAYVGALGRACQIKFWGPVAANPSPARANLGRTTPPIRPSVSLRQGQRRDFDRSVFRCARADDRLLSQFRAVAEMYAATMDILVLQIFNSLFYASVLFLIAARLSLIFGVMPVVNMAHGTFSAVGAFLTPLLDWRRAPRGLPPASLLLLVPP